LFVIITTIKVYQVHIHETTKNELK
jgi:hypothetical protein